MRIDGESGRRGDRGGFFGGDVEPLAERRHGCGHDPLREALLVDERDVVDAQAAAAVGRIEVLAAELQTPGLTAVADQPGEVADVVPRVLVSLLELAVMLFDVGAVAARIGEAVELAADHGLRLVALGGPPPPQPLPALTDVDEAGGGVYEVGAEKGQPGGGRGV